MEKTENSTPYSPRYGEAETGGTGRLKIFFGYAAGVGKTYAMLEAAHQAQKEGVDVVVGYVEPHARPDTLALLEGLEVLSCREVDYRGIRLREFDLDGALARRPQLILVDELAHSNAPSCRHTKRYQDVEELLQAGINVYTTVNVQHLESLNDLVTSITGIVVNERIPDHVFDRANQVELVDIAPADLEKRLEEGKIYRQRQAKQALENFFTAENLTALREIAMRRTADQLNRTAVQEKKGKAARAGDHILICLSSAPSNAKVIRTAARMAEAFHSGFTALFVQTPETKELSGENIKRLRSNLRLAEQLGAQIATVYGADPAEQIAEYARVSGITKIVMGRVNHRQHPWIGQKSLADRLIERTDLDVYIIPDRQPLYKKPLGKLRKSRVRFSWRDAVVTLLCLAISTAVGFAFDWAGFSESNIITIYILGVLVTAVSTSGHLYGAANSLLSVLAFNFFFTEPRFTLQADGPSYPVTFLIMLSSSIIASSLASRVKEQARMAAEKSYYTELLLGSSQKLQTIRTEWDCLRLTAEQLSRMFDRPVIYALNDADKELDFRIEPADEHTLLEKLSTEEIGVAKWVQKNNKHAGATTNTLPDSKWLFLSVRGTRGVMGIVGVPIAGYVVPDAFEKNLMVALLGECGLSQERIRLEEERNQIALQTQRESLQANLLRAVSHDLRTPLTNINGSVGILMGKDQTLKPEVREQLYTAIDDDTNWLINMTENLLAATQLETDRTKLKTAPELLEDLFQSAVRQLDRRARDHHISVDLEDQTLMASMNAGMIQRVIINMMNNAIQYTPKDSHIILSGTRRKDWVEISVSDDGPGIPDEAKKHLFDLFYTAEQGKPDSKRGLGLGLHLCQSIVNAHGGTITVSDHAPSGTTFRFTLPAVRTDGVK
ncbi:sensor histidine kinase KdpD [uncultured Oscillibacter sp.]|uniref:sensor histidine kinase n=1 Tax=uncultured Oscillibacter sp. TaxID=876091 RepID=UPI00266FA722|nr:sensor histidine kinase KdpD [uncultured Oscillibacter sp.]